MKLECNSCDGIYKNSLDIRFTKKCDNNCPFCIEKNGIEGKTQNIDKMISSTIDSKREVVLILGGEPFLEPDKLLNYVKSIRKYKKEIYITTSLPSSFINFKNNEVYDILRLIDGLNVSLNNINSIENNKLFKASSNHNRIEILKNINEEFSNKIRVSINLVKDVIDTKEKILDSIKYLDSIGIKHIKINELQHEPNLYVSFEKIFNIKLKSPYSHGCQIKIAPELLGMSNIKITLKRSCFLVEESNEAYIIDFFKILIRKIFFKKQGFCKVIYENGHKSNGWKTA